MSKRFIDTKPMQADLLRMLQEKFLATEHFNSDTINVSLSLKESVDKVITDKQLLEPQIFILDTAWLKIQMLVKENTGEVAWHCLVERHPNNRFVIYDVLVFPQEVTGATANGIDGEYEMWLATLPDEQFDFVRCHMHSHVNMGVTPSSVDENYYNSLMTQVKEYYITMIINKSNVYHLRFYDKENNLMWYDLTFKICTAQGILYEDWYASVKDNIKTKTHTIPTTIYDKWETERESLFQKQDKKKETTSTTSKIKTGGKTTTKDKEFILASPTGKCLIFDDVNAATNYIYKYYQDSVGITDYVAFSRNNIRTRLAKKNMVCINTTTLEIIDDAENDDGIMEYVIANCDIWEVA